MEEKKEKPNSRRGKFQGRRREARQEMPQKVINVRRVARVMSGGRRFSFSVAIVAGDLQGKVGVGLGKAGDTSSAIEKALRAARRNSIKVALTKTHSIPHEVEAKYHSAGVYLRPAPGRGLVAGSAVRTVLTLAGMKDVNAKIIRPSKNKLNIARATIEALKKLKAQSEKRKTENANT